MNWEAISAIGEIVGALAVVISLVYLAAQIRNQNIRFGEVCSRAALGNIVFYYLKPFGTSFAIGEMTGQIHHVTIREFAFRDIFSIHKNNHAGAVHATITVVVSIYGGVVLVMRAHGH